MFLKFLKFVEDRPKNAETAARDSATYHHKHGSDANYSGTEKTAKQYYHNNHEGQRYENEFNTHESEDIENKGRHNIKRKSQKNKIGNVMSGIKEGAYKKAIGVFVAVMALGIVFKPFFVSGLFIAIGILSRMHQKYLKFPIGIDLVVFGTVVCGAAFGPIFGFFVGMMAYFISIFYTDENFMYLPPALLGVGLVGIASGLIGITSANIVFWGVALTLAYNIFTGAIYFHTYKASLVGGFTFFVTHMWFNYAIFSLFGEMVMRIIA